MSRSFRIGVFLVFTLSIIFGAIFLVGGKNFQFGGTYTLKAAFPSVIGLNEGADVRVGGIREGSVRNLILPKSPDGKIMVVMDLDKRTRNIVKSDSVASIKSEGLLGDKFMEVSFGSAGSPPPKDGDTIASQTPRDIAELVNSTAQVLDATTETMKNIQSISAKIDKGEGTMGALINDRHMYDDARAATERASAGAAAFTDNMEAMKHNFLLRGFFKKRGYEDSAKLTVYEIPKVPSEQPVKKFTYGGEDLFAHKDAAKLKNESKLKEVGAFLEANPPGLVVVEDSTGQVGDSKQNLVLSRARAMVVRDYLAKNFKLDDSRLKTKGWGEVHGDDVSKLEIVVYPQKR